MSQLPPPNADGLITPTVGSWSADKHYYLARYIDIFTTGMKNKGLRLHYIDLFANAGIEDVEGAGLQWGSSLIAALSEPRFHQLHLCELKKDRYQSLAERIQRVPQPIPPQLLCGDANLLVSQVINEIPIDDTLSLAFLDPYGLHIWFDTLRILCQPIKRRIDLVIFFPDRTDALRNIGIYVDNPESTLDAFMGCSHWRKILDKSPRARWAEELRKLYESQLKTLGYLYFDHIRISRPGGGPLYQLIFCSKHERGGDFWRKISKKSPDGQSSLFG